MRESEFIDFPINGIIDLHTFLPKEVKDLIPDYIAACLKRGILSVRIIHGKGSGVLQRVVHSVLRKIPEVVSFHLAGHDEGGWGATIVYLDPSRKTG